MSKIILSVNKLLVKVTGHKYTGFTVKTPFINLSFAPAQIHTILPAGLSAGILFYL